MELSDRISRGLKATLVARIVDFAANGVLIVALANYLLTPEEYGLLYLALNVLGMVAILGSLGLPASSARYVTEFDETDPGQVPHVLRRSVAYLAVLAGGVGVGIVALRGHVSGLLGEPALAPLLLIGGVYVCLRAFTQYTVNVFQGFNRVTWSAVVRSLRMVGQAVFAVGLVLAGLGVVGAMLGYTAGFALAAALGGGILYFGFYRQYDAASTPAPDIRRRILEYSVPLTATRGAAMLDKQVDTVLVGFFLNTTAVGFYTVGKQVAEVSVSVASSLGFTISPALGKQSFAEQSERAARLYESALKNTLLLYVPAAVGLVLVAEPLIVHVLGAEYLGAVVVVQVFAVYVLVNAVTQITTDGLDYLGRARDRAIVKSTMAVSNVLLNVALIPTIGVVGAAVSTAITHTVYAAANVYIMSLELPISVRSLLRSLGWIVPITGAMAVGVLVLLPYVSGVVSLLAVVASGALIWALLSVAGGLIDPRQVRSFLL